MLEQEGGGKTGRQGMFLVRGHPWAVGLGGWRKEAPGEVNVQTEQENLRKQSQGRDQQRGREDGIRGQSARLVDRAGKVDKIQGTSCTLASRWHSSPQVGSHCAPFTGWETECRTEEVRCHLW